MSLKVKGKALVGSVWLRKKPPLRCITGLEESLEIYMRNELVDNLPPKDRHATAMV